MIDYGDNAVGQVADQVVALACESGTDIAEVKRQIVMAARIGEPVGTKSAATKDVAVVAAEPEQCVVSRGTHECIGRLRADHALD